ncbi:hypothetical protein DRP53_02410 [candidate division WOR-3 bacterium]|uniref:Glycosyltransferase RgtA/B/C/D-like domain-containing protein n=1 Tax=candidate division WOR-3 bacterium TaxID=2052148 RepID=A0A660SKD0_UNCW3|nr:MAG: hypothetical protein DRP53_02410 [candidate division WOR-3 bacterium]
MDKRYLIYFFFILLFLIYNPYPFEGGDNIVYSILAYSIASGQGYRSIYEPDSPHHVHYPPGFPLLLTPLVLIFGLKISILKLLPVLAGVLAIIAYSRIDWGEERVAWHSLLLFTVSPVILTYSSRVLSEIPFIATVLLSIYFHQKKGKDLIAWLLAIFALYIRTAGVFLLFGYLLHYLLQRRHRKMVHLLLLSLLLYLPWFIRNRMVSDRPTYLAQFFMVDPYNPEAGQITPLLFLARIYTNLKLYLFEILPDCFFPLPQPVKAILGCLIIGLIIFGLYSSGKEYRFFKSLVLFFFLAILTWPVIWSSDRFLLSGLPLLFPFLVIGSIRLHSYGKYLIYGLALLSLLLTISLIPGEVEKKLRFFQGDEDFGLSADWQRYREACIWAKENLKPGVIVSRKPEFTYFWSGHKSILFPYSYNEEEVWDGIKGYDYIIVDSFYWSGTSRKYLIPAILKHIREIKALYKTRIPETWVLAIKRSTSQ